MKAAICLISIFIAIAWNTTAQTVSKTDLRIDPAFWWTGFENPDLQLLVYTEQAASLEPKIRYKGIELVSTEKTENPNYLFINLRIGPQTKPGKFPITFQRKGQKAFTYEYELRARKAGSATRKGVSNEDVIYLITPDRFANGSLDNDRIATMKQGSDRNDPHGRHGGDIRGMIQHLDYIADMGFTSIWSNPLVENNQESWSYHGYSITDHYAIDPRFGTMEEYLELSEKAEEKGISLVMDMVMNHIGSGHWWASDPPTKDWVNHQWNFSITNHWRETIRDPYASKTDSVGFADGWFDTSMPDLNQRQPLLATYLIQNTIWWVELANLGGIRMDTYSYPDPNFMSEWSCRVRAEYPDFFIVGEEWSLHPSIIAYWQEDNKDGYRSCVPSLMDFPLQKALVSALREKETWSDGWIKLYQALGNDFQYPHPDQLVIFGDNHDMDRFYRQVDQDPALFRLGMAYLATMRGIPQIYYGTEILMTNEEADNHGKIRIDFPGGWPGDETNAFNGRQLSAPQLEAQNYVKKLLNWRKSAPIIHHGKTMHYGPEKGVYVYFRYDADNCIIVALNKNEEATALPLARFQERLTGYQSATDVLTDSTFPIQESLEIPAKSPLILKLNP